MQKCSLPGSCITDVAQMTGIKIHPLSLDKDVWENAPVIVFKSFQVVNSNLTSIKKHCDKVDDKARQASDHQERLEKRLNTADAALQATQDHLQELSDKFQALNKQSDLELRTYSSCIKQLLSSTLGFFERFVKVFHTDIEFGPIHKDGNLADEAPHHELLDVLTNLSDCLPTHLDRVGDACGTFTRWRGVLQEDHGYFMGKTAEVIAATEKTRERLLTWSGILKESRREVDCLSVSLKGTQGQVQEIQAKQVTRPDVDEIVGGSAAELINSIEQTNSVMATVQCSLEEHVTSVSSNLSGMEQNIKEHMDKHSNDVKQMFEREVNPINAYLNKMHIKADEARVELDGLSMVIPRLQSTIAGVSSQLKDCDNENQARTAGINNRVDEVIRSSLDSFERSDASRETLGDNLTYVSRDLNTRIASLQSLQDSMLKTLDTLRFEEVGKLNNDLHSLEQKVVKWIHSAPLPTKVSEARLYALEATLAEEVESRFQLQEDLKEGAMLRLGTAPASRHVPAARMLSREHPPSSRESARKISSHQVQAALSPQFARSALSTPRGIHRKELPALKADAMVDMSSTLNTRRCSDLAS